ncbi:HupE/UreJ family protein [Leptobacterium flavescens]|uniref:HupE/UreJ family protein n=1 Tax=Leptobacterium flavescens TaxID=472055 RepID=A0A6P0UL05_9FLAO|nr:HupE/UreJ family protein [Leptobacterium flavescens]NER13100.1 HupE/UreJ family protein [Leptobacterium flavescens]
MSQFWFYFKLGLTHVLDIDAYDHVLFFVALTIPYAFKDWKRVIWLVTIFTIGHTFSLLLSVYNIVSFSVRLIEFLIPLTIFITAVFNIFTAGKVNAKEKWGVTFFTTLFFGLIHGFGFSNYFRQIVAAADSKLLPTLEFALGIEAAQVIVVLIVLVLSFVAHSIFRFSKKEWILVVSGIVLGFVIPMLRETWPF